MTRTKQILALLVSLAALAVVAPTASAANETDGSRIRLGSLEPNPVKYRTVDPNPRVSPNKPRVRAVAPDGKVRYGSLSPQFGRVRY